MINQYNNNIKITQAAMNQINQLINQKKNKNLKFRIYIIGGGCNGFQYKFKLDGNMNKNDMIIDKKNIIIIDSISLQYVTGGTLDYQINLSGSKFIVSNPNAQNTCSCGISFGI